VTWWSDTAVVRGCRTCRLGVALDPGDDNSLTRCRWLCCGTTEEDVGAAHENFRSGWSGRAGLVI
jgi:hypothetical protein